MEGQCKSPKGAFMPLLSGWLWIIETHRLLPRLISTHGWEFLDQNQKGMSAINNYPKTIELHCCPKAIKTHLEPLITHNFITSNMCTVVYFEWIPHTLYWGCKYKLELKMCINPQQKIGPNTTVLLPSVWGALLIPTGPSSYRKLNHFLKGILYCSAKIEFNRNFSTTF